MMSHNIFRATGNEETFPTGQEFYIFDKETTVLILLGFSV